MRRLVQHLDAAPVSLDPAQSLDYAAQLVLAAVLEPLFVQARPGCFEPGAAASWTPSADGLVHRFRLRRDGRWCDGRPVLAEDFVTAFGRLFDPDRPASPAAAILSPLAEVEATAPRELRLVLQHRVDDLPARLAAPATSPVPAHAGGGEWAPGPCNGPLCVERFEEHRLDLRPNPCARADLRAQAALSIRIDRELHEPLAAFERGELDITCSTWFPFERLSRFAGRPELHTAGSPIRFLICGNEDRAREWGLGSRRAALSACLDRRAIADSLAGGVLPWPVSAPEESAAAAVGPPPPARSLIVPDFYPNLAVAEAVAAAWSRAGLCDLRIERLDFPDFAGRWRSRDYELCLALVAPPYPSGDALAPALAALAPADVRTRALELAGSVEKATGADRRAARAELEDLYARSMPFVPLLAGRSIWLQRAGIDGYATFPDGGHSFKRLRASS